MLGLPILYFKGMRLMMFQLSGFYCRVSTVRFYEDEPKLGKSHNRNSTCLGGLQV